MKFDLPSRASIAILLLFTSNISAQTYSNCNPLTQGTCPPDSALGKSVNIDFTNGASDSFTAQGSPTYNSDGVSFTVAKSGDSPQLTSKWYIMFGKVEVVAKPAPGAGIVSSFVLQSDDLDEIDWEWLGGDPDEVQTNYFGKGITGSYNRGAFNPDAGSQSGFKTYTVDWSANQIVWQINGVTVRALTAANAEPNQYPQTPMQVKVGAWSGGDPSNSPGTIQWAGGPTDYSKGPFSMLVKSISVTDYSTGTQYSYNGNSGNWQDIAAVNGKVNSQGGGSPVGSSDPAVTSVSTGQPMPFQGSNKHSIVSTPTGYPWVPSTMTTSASTITYTNYPGLPSGWTVSNSGKVVPPNSAPARTFCLSCFLFEPPSLTDVSLLQTASPASSISLLPTSSPPASSSSGASRITTSASGSQPTAAASVPPVPASGSGSVPFSGSLSMLTTALIATCTVLVLLL
jgi:beta-glucanase (GH16 family)